MSDRTLHDLSQVNIPSAERHPLHITLLLLG